MKNNKYVYLITLLYFTMGFINIHFALLGVACMTIPIFLLIKYRKKTWCQGYCPRANLFTTLCKVKGKKNKRTPDYS